MSNLSSKLEPANLAKNGALASDVVVKIIDLVPNID